MIILGFCALFYHRWESDMTDLVSSFCATNLLAEGDGSCGATRRVVVVQRIPEEASVHREIELRGRAHSRA